MDGSKTINLSLDDLRPARQIEIVERKPDWLLLRTLPGTDAPALELKPSATLDFVENQPSLLSRVIPVFILFGGAALSSSSGSSDELNR